MQFDMMPVGPVSPDRTLSRPPGHTDAALRAVAIELEAGFLSEMLKHAGFGESRQSFGGGAGEDQFASLLRMDHAREMAEQGGIGLAESIFQSLVSRAPVAEGDRG